MRNKIAALAMGVLLASCGLGETARAEKEYDLVRKTDLSRYNGDRCAAAQRVKDAYMRAGDREKFELWSLIQYSDCLRVD